MSSTPPNIQRAERSLLADTVVMVLAGGRGTRMRELTAERAKPALPFGGVFRIIDFTLSNCINSGLRRVAVLTQYKAQSLIRHLGRGWNFVDAAEGEFIDVVPAQQRIDTGWYSGTADAVFQNLGLVRRLRARHVLVLAGDHVCRMNYGVMLAEHVQRGADASVACIEVPTGEAASFGVMSVDSFGRVIDFEEKPVCPLSLPGHEGRALASMGIYVFDADTLSRHLADDARRSDSGHDFGRDILPRMMAQGRLHAHRFVNSCVAAAAGEPYWRDVGTLDAYWQAQLDLAQAVPPIDLHDPHWPIRTTQRSWPAAHFVDHEGHPGCVSNSLAAGGCLLHGASVRRSVLSADVHVGPGSEIEESVLLPGVRVGAHVVLRRVVVDKRCVLPDGLRIGLHPGEDAARFTVSDKGVTLVTRAMLAR